MRKHRIASLLLGAIITIGSVSVFSGSVAGATTVGDMSGFQLVSNGSVKYSISTALATAEDGPTKDYEAAIALQDTMSNMCGGASVTLTYKYMSSRKKEIIVGSNSDQEKRGKITVDRSELQDDGFIITVSDERIIITGKTGEGTWNGVEYFIKNYLGYDVWNDSVMPTDVKNIGVPKNINVIEKGTDKTKTPLVTIDESGTFTEHRYGDIDYDSMFSHNAYDTMRNQMYCYSKEENIKSIISRRVPRGKIIYNTLLDVCNCDACQAAAREEGTEMGAYFRLIRRAAQENPDKRITILAMNRTFKAPVSSLGSNVDVIICDRKLCSAHSIGDSSCPVNRAFAENLAAWKKLCGSVSVVDFTSDYFYFPSTFPNLFVMRENAAYYKAQGVKNVYMQFDTKMADLEFVDLRCYLADALLKDPGMSESRYTDIMNKAIAYYYGAENADSIRAYIDLSTEASKASGCFDIYSRPEKVIPAKTGVGNGIDAYDLTFAKAAYKLWNDILPYPSTAVCARSRYSLAISSQYMSSAENHAKMQFYTYVSQIADPADRTAVARAVMGK